MVVITHLFLEHRKNKIIMMSFEVLGLKPPISAHGARTIKANVVGTVEALTNRAVPLRLAQRSLHPALDQRIRKGSLLSLNLVMSTIWLYKTKMKLFGVPIAMKTRFPFEHRLEEHLLNELVEELVIIHWFM